MTNYCRLCAELKEPDDFVTTITDAENLIEQKLSVCCQWKVKNTSQRSLPQAVCSVCLDKLDKCWIFAQSVKLAQHKLEEIFENEGEQDSDHEDKILPSNIVKIVFDCTDCSRDFPSRIAFEEHECNSENANNQCDVCHEKFRNNNELRVHSEKHAELRCEICLQVFCKTHDLKIHQDQGCERLIESPSLVDGKPTFIDCSSEPGTSLAQEEQTPFACEIIPEEIGSSEDEGIDQSNYLDNYNLTEDDNVQSEPSSSRMRKKPKAKKKQRKVYRERLGSDSDATDRIFHCYLCEKRFKKFPLLRDHMIIHTLPNRIKCQYCNSRFRTLRHYTSHQRKHLEYFCDVCNKKFVSAFTLKVHKRIHEGSCTKMYGCEECDHYFVDVSAYYNHAKRRHGITSAEAKRKCKIIEPNGTLKPLICHECGKDFFSLNRLNQHALVHLQDRPFKCTVCPKTFKNKYNLKSHMERHTKEKSVQCTVCFKKYNHKQYLIKHMRIHDSANRKMFQCEFCDKVVTNTQSLQIHRRKHTGEKPYSCEPCSYAAPSRSQLMRHRESIAHMNKMNEQTQNV